MTNNHNIKVKKWNFIALILCGIEIVLSIIDLPGSLNPDKTFYQKLGNDGRKIFNQLNSMPIKIFAVLNLLIVIAFFILFFNANKSLILTISGGIIGYLLGMILAYGIGSLIKVHVSVDLFTIILAVGVSSVIGLVFSVMPASEAAKKDLIDILR